MRVKICGINSREALAAASDAGADYVGFVFFARSPRAVTAAQAANIMVNRGGPKRIGLFVKPRPEDIAAVLAEVPLDGLQLYGITNIEAFRRFALPLWVAHGAATALDLPAHSNGADELVIEAKPPATANRPGGNATSFDWAITAGWQPPTPWWLAGGLTPENVAEALESSGAVSVDVSSGVESAPGVKDPGKIRGFIEAVRKKALLF